MRSQTEPSISLLSFLSEHAKLMVAMFLASYLNSYLMMLKFTRPLILGIKTFMKVTERGPELEQYLFL